MPLSSTFKPRASGGRGNLPSSSVRLSSWLDGVASPPVIVGVLVLWLLVALGLHLLLVNDSDDPGLMGDHNPLSMAHFSSHGAWLRHGKKQKPAKTSRHHQSKNHHPHPHEKEQDNDPPVNRRPRNVVREQYEAKYPPTDTARIQNFVASLRDDALDAHVGSSSSSARNPLPYNPLDCPDTPPPGYPLHYALLDVLHEWPVDVLQWPGMDETNNSADHPYLFHSLCIFDWDNPLHRPRIPTYQIDYDVPIVVRNHPQILQTTERWMRQDPAYLHQLIGDDDPQRTEHATASNHLPFWRLGRYDDKGPPGWEPPTDNQMQTFSEWDAHAQDLAQAVADGHDHTTRDHYYFRLNGDDRQHDYLYDELPWFDPQASNGRPGKNVFLWEPELARGINCRWGMAGNVAEAHYDDGRNWIVLLGGGQRRYILAHPQQCPHMSLFPVGHPSARHSSVNWSEIIGPENDGPAARALAHAQVTQVVLQASDALFLPAHWFHFIVSLNRNYQCNARSGTTDTYRRYIRECGFPT